MNKALIPRIAEELDSSFFDDFFFPARNTLRANSSTMGNGLSVYEDKEAVYVEAWVPGLEPEDVDLTFEKGVLWIKGEKKEEQSEEKKYHYRSDSTFSYRVSVPRRLDESTEPEATCKNGIITVRFNKSKSEQPRKIEIKNN